MKSLRKPYGDSIWILTGRWVLASVHKYRFFVCECTCDCESSALCWYLYTNENWGPRGLECARPSALPVSMFVFAKGSHIPRLSASPQHTRTGVRTGESGSPDCGAWPRWANITLSLSLPPSDLCLPLSLSHSMSVCLPLGLAVFSLSHCAKHREPLCYSEKEMQPEPNLPCFLSNIILPLFLRSHIMCLASNNISMTLGNKWRSDEIDLVMSWMSDFKCSSRWHLG